MQETEAITEETIRNYFVDVDRAYWDIVGLIDSGNRDMVAMDDKKIMIVNDTFRFWRGKIFGFRGYQSSSDLTTQALVDELHGYAKVRLSSDVCEFMMEVHGGKLTKFEKRETTQLDRKGYTDSRTITFT